MVIEIDAADIGPDYPYIRAAFSGVAGLHSCIYVLSGSRYAGQDSPTSVP